MTAIVIVVSSSGSPAAGQERPEFANAGVGKDDMLLAQAETSSQKKSQVGKKRPVINVDEKGVILKGYDPVAYFKQNRPVRGTPKYSSQYEGATYYFASGEDKAEFDKARPRNTRRNTEVSVPTV